jgi:hypothetical protein
MGTDRTSYANFRNVLSANLTAGRAYFLDIIETQVRGVRSVIVR